MIFTETKIKGAFIVEPTKIEDDRGFFTRIWCKKQFEMRGLASNFVQCNTSFSKKMGTLRGLHYQVAPFQEAKLIRSNNGAIYSVILDLRPESPTYKQWLGVELSSDNNKMLYVPEGVANGFQTIKDNTQVSYPVSQFYSLEHERGIRWDDPQFSIRWPQEVDVGLISEKDKNWPNFSFQEICV